MPLAAPSPSNQFNSLPATYHDVLKQPLRFKSHIAQLRTYTPLRLTTVEAVHIRPDKRLSSYLSSSVLNWATLNLEAVEPLQATAEIETIWKWISLRKCHCDNSALCRSEYECRSLLKHAYARSLFLGAEFEFGPSDRSKVQENYVAGKY